jgi:nucleotidyltransferase/DNA polymerase involved in DNA repair
MMMSEKERRREELSRTGGEIARLWTLLKMPINEREQFQSSFQMNLSVSTLNIGNAELRRLKEIRTQSLGVIISSLRTEINNYWSEIGIINDEQKWKNFHYILWKWRI